MRATILGVVMTLLLATPCLIVAADAAASTQAALASATRVLDITDVILRNHIDPPTRQQMVLNGAKSLYRAGKRPLEKGISERISELATRDELAAYVAELHAEFQGLKQIETAMLQGILSAVPGGGRIVEAKTLEVQGQLNANRYVGTGIALAMDGKTNLPVISKVFYGGPAWKAGVKSGDLMLDIDGTSTASMKLNEIVPQLRGHEGDQVKLKVRQPQTEDVREVTVTLGVAFIPTVEGHRQVSDGDWQYLVEPEMEIAYVRINRIGSSTVHELRQVESKLRETPPRGIVFDLRFGGGTLHDIILVADALLDGGEIGRVESLDRVQTHMASPGTLFKGVPMVILVDRYASGGREFLAAALQDGQRARVVGERTGSAGYVRSGVALPDRDEELIIATGIMQRSNGTPLLTTGNPTHGLSRVVPLADLPEHMPNNRWGFVMPDYVVSLTLRQREELAVAYSFTRPGLAEPTQDPVLAKAVEVLRAGEEGVSSTEADEGASG